MYSTDISSHTLNYEWKGIIHYGNNHLTQIAYIVNWHMEIYWFYLPYLYSKFMIYRFCNSTLDNTMTCISAIFRNTCVCTCTREKLLVLVLKYRNVNPWPEVSSLCRTKNTARTAANDCQQATLCDIQINIKYYRQICIQRTDLLPVAIWVTLLWLLKVKERK